jgi:hypothetical protein
MFFSVGYNIQKQDTQIGRAPLLSAGRRRWRK